MSDFIAPKVKGYIGLSAMTAGIGMDKLVKSNEEKNDEYGKIMARALAMVLPLLRPWYIC